MDDLVVAAAYAEMVGLAFTLLAAYFMWAAGLFDWMRPGLEQSRWGLLKIRAGLRWLFRRPAKPTAPAGPTLDFTPTVPWKEMMKER